MRLIFSRDRAAQLDLLLRSLQRFAPHEQTTVIWDASDIEFVRAYEQLPLSVDGYAFGIDFNHRLRQALWTCPDQTVTFFCDDDVMIDDAPAPDLLTRLGTFSDQVLDAQPPPREDEPDVGGGGIHGVVVVGTSRARTSDSRVRSTDTPSASRTSSP